MQIQRHADRDRGIQRRRDPILAQVFQENIAAEREAGRQHGSVVAAGPQRLQEKPDVVGLAGVIPPGQSVPVVIADLPRSIREYVENVPVLVEDFPSRDLLSGEGISPQILGLFQGVPRTEAAVSDQPSDLDRVMLFKKNLEKVCRTHAELVEQIQITVKHEIGHYLGLDEDDLGRLGLA